MANDKQITTKLEQFVKSNENKFKSDSFQRLSIANDKYNKLVSTGLVKKRGFTLRGIEDMHLFHVKIN
jgi:hypothetical protein